MTRRINAVRKKIAANARPAVRARPVPARNTASKAAAGAANASDAATLKPRNIAARLSFDPLNDSTDSSINSSAHIQEANARSEEHTSELQSLRHLVCR